MDHAKKNSRAQSSSFSVGTNLLVPKPEIVDFDFPSNAIYSTQLGDNVASSSQGNLRSFFSDMGFSSSLIDKVIEENGEENVDQMLEILIEYSNLQKSRSSDSLDSLFDDKEKDRSEYTMFGDPKEEPDLFDTVDDDKRDTLLKMNFSVNEVEFAMHKLGAHAPIDELVDFITAAQIAENFDKEPDNNINNGDVEIIKDCNNETLYGTMETTLGLLQLGFTENEVSLAIERFGSDVPILELANAICAEQAGEVYVIKKEKYASQNLGYTHSHGATCPSSFNTEIKNEPRDLPSGAVKLKLRDTIPQSRDMILEEARRGKRPKEEDIENWSDVQNIDIDFEESYRGKRPKEEYSGGLASYSETTWIEEKTDPTIMGLGMPSGSTPPSSFRSLDKKIAKPPYFFYGNVVSGSGPGSLNSWGKISQFLYEIEPEFVNTQFFSAMSRNEGYVHNLPTDNRFHILPPPMTLQDALPHTKKWWPSWDTRKQLSSFSLETSGASHVCDRLERMLKESRGLISLEKRREILHYCQKLNLIWVGPYKLRPVEPDHMELILGYPINHTQAVENNLKERLQSLSHCFQVDTLVYHLSVLKSMYPEGITMLSIFSGIGAAEVALHRLGIHLKAVVSVETCEINRKILRNWWHRSKQTGQLEQIDDIQKLTGNKIDRFIEKFGRFDFIICQNSCSQSSKVNSKMVAHAETRPVFDFSLFYEFVRILQRLRNARERNR